MKKQSKRLTKAKEAVVPYPVSPEEGIELLKKTATANFIESTEVHIFLNIDPKYSDQQLRATVILPNGSGKIKKIAVLLPEEKIKEEYRQIADVVGSIDLIEKISSGYIDFDVLIASPEMMPNLAKLGKILGPKGLMPSPKAGTVTNNIEDAIEEFKRGKIEYRADRAGIVRLSFGKVNFSTKELLENLRAVYSSIEQNKPSGVKGKYFKLLSMCTTMGPLILVNLNNF
uniref:ribosomal protein L1 n=1 Tax=Fibrocapsa japonica TaxID=94617 RepID=UPI0021158AE6|nr:ribosomal protein L1 [Fibrocapsa japonica]UTE95211.1 ribosomal protein L1 [Fibrocapsa japonica]